MLSTRSALITVPWSEETCFATTPFLNQMSQVCPKLPAGDVPKAIRYSLLVGESDLAKGEASEAAAQFERVREISGADANLLNERLKGLEVWPIATWPATGPGRTPCTRSSWP